MIWSGHPHFRTYQRRARQARAQAFADLFATVRRAVTRRLAVAAWHTQHRWARPRPSL